MSALAVDPESTLWRLDLPGRSVALFEGEITLGRSRGCGIVLADPCISRVHALVAVRSGRVYVQDLRSSNGTFVDGERISGEREITEGDRIAIGNYDLVLHLGPAGEQPLVESTAGDVEGAESGATREMDAVPSLWQRVTGQRRGK
ncbi:MAG TPA: FHA domain-containing protein [Thermoanaerobaculia bacterium]|jgi:pSer/pThr/pTyr-binding forkhead associated (FHA) protein|nr:FHA domain-containing protein [Thermoanaerobaculia bacterium]